MRVFGYVGHNGTATPNIWLLPALNGRLPRLILSVIVTGSENGIADEDAEFVAQSFSRQLREEMVDKWIDSGRTGEAENPWERVAPPLLGAFGVRNPPVLSVDAEGPYLMLMPHTRNEGKSLAAAVIDGAMAMCLQLLDSPTCRRLFRCDGCSVYFMRTRAPKKDTPIYHGSYCANCKRKGKDRIRRTEDSRAERTGQMIGLAADVWPQWKQDRRHGERTEWVAQQVNKRRKSNRGRIAKNWVTRHQAEIEAEVERRKHAKG